MLDRHLDAWMLTTGVTSCGYTMLHHRALYPALGLKPKEHHVHTLPRRASSSVWSAANQQCSCKHDRDGAASPNSRTGEATATINNQTCCAARMRPCHQDTNNTLPSLSSASATGETNSSVCCSSYKQQHRMRVRANPLVAQRQRLRTCSGQATFDARQVHFTPHAFYAQCNLHLAGHSTSPPQLTAPVPGCQAYGYTSTYT
jgi:hypothetical protein